MTVASYTYDSQNRRISKTVGANTTHYIYDLNSQLIAETLADGTPLRDYFYLEGQPLAVREYQNNPSLYYFLNDHLGTPQQLITPSGTVVWQAAYLPYGEAQIQTNTVANNLRFPGQYFDAETGLQYNWHRYYDPVTGRYISADPIGLEGGMNLYAYVGGNPVNWSDPEGLNPATGALTGGSLGAAIGGSGSLAGIVGTGIAGGLVGYGAYAATSWALDGTWLGNGGIGDLVYDLINDPMQSSAGNQVHTAIQQAYGNYASSARLNCEDPKDRCKWLEENAHKFPSYAVKATAKAWGCRGSRWSGGNRY